MTTEQDETRVEEVRDKLFGYIADCAMELRDSDIRQVKLIDDYMDLILSLKDKDGKPMLGIISDDQSLPAPIDNQHLGSLTVMGTKDMKDNFRRVIIEGE